MIEKILLAYDGSDSSRKAFDLASDLAQRYQAELFVLTVAEVPEFPEEVETAAMVEHSRTYHQKLLDELAERAGTLGAHLHLELVVGHPARQILAEAARSGVDLIVLGQRGRGLLDRWRLGSVSHRVIAYAECPVTVVR